MEEERAEATIPLGATMKSCTHKRLLRENRERRKREKGQYKEKEGGVEASADLPKTVEVKSR